MIKFIIKLFFKKEIEERKKIRKHNADIIQNLLDKEHAIRDAYNLKNGTVYTTAKAIVMARLANETDYNPRLALRNNGYKFLMNEKEDAPDVLITTLPSLHLYTTIISKVIGEHIATIIAATSNPTSLTLT